MLTVFEKIPDLFVQHYDVSFRTMGAGVQDARNEVRDPV